MLDLKEDKSYTEMTEAFRNKIFGECCLKMNNTLEIVG